MDVTTVVESAGQSVTVAAQLVIVISLVLYTVDTVHLPGVLEAGLVTTTAGVVVPTAGVEMPAAEEGTEAVGTETGGLGETETPGFPGIETTVLPAGTEAVGDEIPGTDAAGVVAGPVGKVVAVLPGVQSKPMV